MLRENYEIGVRIASGEISTFRALARLSRQPVMIHVLPADAEKQRYWQDRIRERQLIDGDALFLGIGEHEGLPYLVTKDIPRFVGFPEWLATPPAPLRTPNPEGATKGGLPSSLEEEDPKLNEQLGATERLNRAAPPPKRKRDYRPPNLNQPSEYSQQFSHAKLSRQPPASAPVSEGGHNFPISAPPVGGESSAMPQELVVSGLQDQLRLWRIIAIVAAGFAAISLVALLILVVRQS